MQVVFVLMVGLDGFLVETRCALLRAAGYLVESVYSMNEAAHRFLEGDFDMVLLCHTIPTRERHRLIRSIRATGSRTPVVYLARGVGEEDAYASATVESSPEKFLQGIRETVAKEARSWAEGGQRMVVGAFGKKPVRSTGEDEWQEQVRSGQGRAVSSPALQAKFASG